MSVDDWLLGECSNADVRGVFSDLPPGSQSLLALLSLIAGAGGSAFFFDQEALSIDGGAEALVRAMRQDLALPILVRARVRGLVVDRGSVTINSTGPNGESSRFGARVVVFAIPPACWLQVRGLQTHLPRRIPKMVQNRKLCLLVDVCGLKRWRSGIDMLTDGPCRLLSSTALQDGTVAKIDVLVCPFFGPVALRQRDLSRIALNLCGVSEKRLLHTHEQRWDRSSFSKGTYPVLGPDVLGSGYEGLLEGSPPVFFAGDHVIPGFAGYMEGALRSAEHAADQVRHYLDRA
jgi:monoamine oxidase